MRIAHLVSHDALNGVATSCRTLIEAQRAAGHEIFLAVSPNSWLAANLDPDGVTLLESRFKTRPKEIARVGYAIRDWGCDVVHCHGSRANKFGLVYRFAGSIPVVATAHAALFQLPWRWFSAIIAPSQATADFHARVNWTPRRRIHLVTNAVPALLSGEDRAAAGRKARQALGLGDEEFVIGSVGEIGGRKNQVDLLRAMTLLPDDLGPVTLVLIGGMAQGQEPMPGWNEALAAASVRHRVVLAGKRNDGAALTAGFDLFGFVSRMEQGPIAPLEAMAHATPVLTWRVGNLPELIEHGRTGFLVEQGDVEGFASLVAELARDRERLRQVGENARQEIIAHLSPAAMERATQAVYRAVIGPRPPAVAGPVARGRDAP